MVKNLFAIGTLPTVGTLFHFEATIAKILLWKK